jgi:hypothetical protein
MYVLAWETIRFCFAAVYREYRLFIVALLVGGWTFGVQIDFGTNLCCLYFLLFSVTVYFHYRLSCYIFLFLFLVGLLQR